MRILQAPGVQPLLHCIVIMHACCLPAGEQRKRDYNWSKARIDPKQHRFGRVDSKGQQSSMKQVSSAPAGAGLSSCFCGVG
jgi:hypothetical protein